VTSAITSSPSESADVRWNVTVSPVTGFAIESPVRIIRLFLLFIARIAARAVMGISGW
jgi:hypothetical protein